MTAAAHRLAMAQLAITGNPWFEVSAIELDRGMGQNVSGGGLTPEG